MDMRLDTAPHRTATRPPRDHDLHDDFIRSAHRGWWFPAIVALDALTIAAFIAWIVIPKLA